MGQAVRRPDLRLDPGYPRPSKINALQNSSPIERPTLRTGCILRASPKPLRPRTIPLPPAPVRASDKK